LASQRTLEPASEAIRGSLSFVAGWGPATVKEQTESWRASQVLTRNDADAADATQDAFLDAFRNLAAFDVDRPFYPWFYVLLRNRCFKQQSRRTTRQQSDELPDSAVAPRVSETQLDVWRAIGRLSAEDAEIVVLKHIEGWTYQELAAALQIPRGTVMSRLYTARRRLSALLSGETS
jgi:RNA polymerase sigma-70 factor (ECF subfamily)